jgi:repressor LexA
MPKPLTNRQQEVYDYIESYIDDNNRPPTISDIKKTFGFKSPQSVVDHLHALEKKGHIKRLPNSRGIVLLNEKDHFPILGKVAAGAPLEVEELFDGNFHLEDYYKPEQTFVLSIQGDSMKDIGIYDGDKVMIIPKSSVNNGDIVVAVIDGEYTVKRFFRENNKILLKPENPTYEPIIIEDTTDDFRIIGEVVGVHRFIK